MVKQLTWAVSVAAIREHDTNIEFVHQAIVFCGPHIEWIEAQGILFAQRIFRSTDGWKDHTVNAVEVSSSVAAV